MKSIKKLTALLCAFACVFSLTGVFTVANEENLIEPLDNTGLYVDRSGAITYLCGVPCGSTASSVENLIKGEAEVYSNASAVTSGDKVTLFTDGIPTDTATIITTGDINGDGIINGKDTIRLKKLMGTTMTDPVQRRLCDVNNDGKIDSGDTSKVVSMTSARIESVSFIGNPEKTAYLEGEEFSPKGLYMNVKYYDGTVLSYGDGFDVTYPSGNDYFEKTDTKVTLRYGNFSKNVSVTVEEVTYFEARITKNDSSLSVAFNDTNVQLSDTALKSSQVWAFTKQSDGSFEIKNKDTGKCIEVEGSTAANSQNIRVASDNNSSSQRWNITRTKDGEYTVKSALGAYVMDIHAGNVASGSNLQIYTPNGTAAQSFCIEPVTEIEKKIDSASFVDLGTDFLATLTGVASENNVGLIASGSANVAMKASEKTVRQLWRFSKQSDGSYIIINQENGTALNADSSANVTSAAKNSKNAQKWFVLQDSNGYTLIPKSSSKYVLDVEKASIENDANVQLEAYKNNFASQRFSITKFTGNYLDYTAPVYIGTHFNATISPSYATSKKISLSGGKNAIIYGASEFSEQTWRFEHQSDNTYKIVNNSNGNVLTIPNGNTAGGTQLQVASDTGAKSQRWYLLPKEDMFVIKSAMSANVVVDVYGASTNDSTKIDIYTPNMTAAQIFKIDNSQMTAMSYNVYCGNVTADRMNRVITKMKKYMPDTIGIQEATPTWINNLKASLGDTYDIVGLGRDGGSAGEHSSILYNKHIFNLKGWGTKWLSATPDVVSRYPESMYNRIFTYAFLQRKVDNQMILVINTHLEYTTDAIRLKQLAIIQDFVNKNGNGYPVYISGDYNADFGSAACTKMEQYGYKNGSTAAKSFTGATFTNYGAENRILDYIYFSKNDFTLNYYKVCNEYINGSWTSDHHPIYVRYQLNK